MRGVLLGEIALRLLAALALGGALGLERSYHGRPAGFRTHALVVRRVGRADAGHASTRGSGSQRPA